jgi:hypothetical protein
MVQAARHVMVKLLLLLLLLLLVVVLRVTCGAQVPGHGRTPPVGMRQSCP